MPVHVSPFLHTRNSSAATLSQYHPLMAGVWAASPEKRERRGCRDGRAARCHSGSMRYPPGVVPSGLPSSPARIRRAVLRRSPQTRCQGRSRTSILCLRRIRRGSDTTHSIQSHRHGQIHQACCSRRGVPRRHRSGETQRFLSARPTRPQFGEDTGPSMCAVLCDSGVNPASPLQLASRLLFRT